MSFSISVIICAHNPKAEYLERVLSALQGQTLEMHYWELLLIDNHSDAQLSSLFDISWHPHGKHICEEKLGLTQARLCGIEHSIGEILVFVDDDNVLEESYLEVVLEIEKKWKILGAWGGQVKPEFEVVPPEWTRKYWPLLAIREFDHDSWSNLLHQNDTTPCGAGLCVRQEVAKKYSELAVNDLKRKSLGRKGNLLTACEDTDFAFTACDIGLGTGQFTTLSLTHIIPKKRVEENYLLRLVEGIAYSGTILAAIRGKFRSDSCLSQRIYDQYVYWRLEKRERRFYAAKKKGVQMAISEIAQWNLV